MQSSPSSPGSDSGPGVLGAESVGDPLVRGISLTVDAVRVDLQQTATPCPAQRGHLGRRHTGVQPQRHRRVPQVIRAPAERRPALGRGEACLRASVHTSLYAESWRMPPREDEPAAAVMLPNRMGWRGE
jgi:hypothetical protein